MLQDVVLNISDLTKAGHEDLVTAVMETTGESSTSTFMCMISIYAVLCVLRLPRLSGCVMSHFRLFEGSVLKMDP